MRTLRGKWQVKGGAVRILQGDRGDGRGDSDRKCRVALLAHRDAVKTLVDDEGDNELGEGGRSASSREKGTSRSSRVGLTEIRVGCRCFLAR